MADKIDEDDNDFWMSLYLHSSRKQALLNNTKKQSFRFGILKVNKLPNEVYKLLGEDVADEVYFPPNSSKIATFDGMHKCFGLQKFIPLGHIVEGRILQDKGSPGLKSTFVHQIADLRNKLQNEPCEHNTPRGKCKTCKPIKLESDDIKKELLSGQFTKGGSITLILDMSVTDEENWAVSHGLLMLKRYGNQNKHFARCNETERKFANPSPCYMCGKLYNQDVLQVNKTTRFPAWGFETGIDLIMDILVREEEHQLSQMMSNLSFERKYDEGKLWLTKKLTSLRKYLEEKQQAPGKAGLGKGGGGGDKSAGALTNFGAGFELGMGGEEEETAKEPTSQFMEQKFKAELNKQENFQVGACEISSRRLHTCA
jgi:hypothetical protein